MTKGGPDGAAAVRTSVVSSLRTGPIEAMRAPDSIRAFATGCDHRVGGAGLET
jgi:hypothetical protein